MAGVVYSSIFGTTANDKNREYEFERKGKFVIAYNYSFDYIHRGVDHKDPKVEKTTMSDYKSDAEKIMSTFQLKPEDVNLQVGINLTPFSENNEEDDQFDGFVERLLRKDVGQPDPTFLMFFLMSHGDRYGEFLLSQQSGSRYPCCTDDDHNYKDECRARKVYDLIHKIDNASSQKFLGKPKIFIMQAYPLSGPDVPPSKGPKPKPLPDADRFIPECSDVFIFYACTESQLVLKSFCESVKHVLKSYEQSNKLWDELCKEIVRSQAGVGQDNLQALNTHIKEMYDLDKLKLCSESVTDGWIEGVCRQTISRAVDILVKEGTKANKDDRLSEQHPQYASTLRFKLSMIKLLNTQQEIIHDS